MLLLMRALGWGERIRNNEWWWWWVGGVLIYIYDIHTHIRFNCWMLGQSLSTDVAVGLAHAGPAVVQSGDWATTDAPIACIGKYGVREREIQGAHARTHARTQRSTVGSHHSLDLAARGWTGGRAR